VTASTGSLLALVYLFSLGAVASHSWSLAAETLRAEHSSISAGFLLATWFGAIGLLISACNVMSVVGLLAGALRARALWLTVRKRRLPDGPESLCTVMDRMRVCEDERMEAESPWMVSRLLSRYRLAWPNVRRAWGTDGLRARFVALRDAVAHFGTDPPDSCRGPFFVLERKGERWTVAVPRTPSGDGWYVRVRRPSVRKQERLGSGDRITVQEGDVVTFEDREDWYVQVERVRP